MHHVVGQVVEGVRRYGKNFMIPSSLTAARIANAGSQLTTSSEISTTVGNSLNTLLETQRPICPLPSNDNKCSPPTAVQSNNEAQFLNWLKTMDDAQLKEVQSIHNVRNVLQKRANDQVARQYQNFVNTFVQQTSNNANNRQKKRTALMTQKRNTSISTENRAIQTEPTRSVKRPRVSAR
jgi:hypothetical protein